MCVWLSLLCPTRVLLHVPLIPTGTNGFSLQTHVTLNLGYFSGRRTTLGWHTGRAGSAREPRPQMQPLSSVGALGHAAHSVPDSPLGLSHTCPQRQTLLSAPCWFPSPPHLLFPPLELPGITSQVRSFYSNLCLRVRFWGKWAQGSLFFFFFL